MKKIASVVLIILLTTLLILPQSLFAAELNVNIVKGKTQKVQVGRTAKQPLKVRITDSRGVPVKTPVKFKVVSGEGKLNKTMANTDGNGYAKVYFIAGLSAGKVKIVAHPKNAPSVKAVFLMTVSLDNPFAKRTYTKPSGTTGPKPKNTPIKFTPKKFPVTPGNNGDNGSIAPPSPVPAPGTPDQPSSQKSSGKPSIIIVSGENNIKVQPRNPVNGGLSVQVMDELGKPLPGINVIFKIEEGSGTLQPIIAVTNHSGVATAQFQSSSTEEEVIVRAVVAGSSNLSTVFNVEVTRNAPIPTRPVATRTPLPTVPRPTATTRPPVGPRVNPNNINIPSNQPNPRGFYSRNPEKIVVVGGNYQMGTPGTRLAQPIVVYVTDSDGNPAEATVNFSILAGEASVTARQVRTDNQGLASTFAVVHSQAPIRLVAEVNEKPGLAVIAYANVNAPANNGGQTTTKIQSNTPTNVPGYPAAVAFYSAKSSNDSVIARTGVVPLEIGVTDFRNQPVSTDVRFSVLKGRIKILNPVVKTGEDGKGTCYVDVGNSMGIFTVQAQSLINPDLKAQFKSGPQVRSGPATEVVRPGGGSSAPSNQPSEGNDSSFAAPPPSTPDSGKPSLIAIIDGGGQKGKPRQKLPKPVVVLITDKKGAPIVDSLVSFAVTRGSATLTKPFSRTDSSGYAQTYVKLGRKTGTIEITVKVQDNKRLQTTINVECVK